MIYKFKFRRGLAAEWTADNPILLAGEPGFETDTGKLKLGDGVQAWSTLGYYPPAELSVAGVASVDGRDGVVTLDDLYAALAHIHAQADITGLVPALSGKAASVHTHAESEVVDLDADLAALATDISGKASASHTHVVSPAIVVLTDAPTIAVNATLGERFRVTLTGDHILGNPTGAVDGQMLLFEIVQDGVGGQALTLGTKFNDPNGYFTGQSTAAGKRDKLGVQYNLADDQFDVLAFSAGF